MLRLYWEKMAALFYTCSDLIEGTGPIFYACCLIGEYCPHCLWLLDSIQYLSKHRIFALVSYIQYLVSQLT